MLAVRAALDALTLRRDGVDGKSHLPLRRGLELRRGRRQRPVRAGHPGQPRRHRASAPSPTGCATRSAAAARSTTTRACRASAPACAPTRTARPVNGTAPSGARCAHDTDLVTARARRQPRRSPSRTARADGAAVRRSTTTAQPAGYADQPDEVITYVDAHDNETLFDALTVQAAGGDVDGRPGADEHAVAGHHRAGADAVVLARGRRPAAQQVRWTATATTPVTGSTGSTGPAPDNGFGHGLPPEADNGAKWPYMKPLLANAALKPATGRRAAASRQAPGPAAAALLLAAVPARLGAGLISAKVGFPVSGTADAHPGVIVMRIDDTVGPRRRPGAQGPRGRLQRLADDRDAEGARDGGRRASPCRRCRPVGRTRSSRPPVGRGRGHADRAGAHGGGLRPALIARAARPARAAGRVRQRGGRSTGRGQR